MPSILAYSDIQFIFMDPKMDMQGFPSKVYTIMACGKPLLVCSGKDTPIINFLSNNDCAKLIVDNNYSRKVEEMKNWLLTISSDNLRMMGDNGINHITEKYSKDIVTQQYVNLVESLIK